MKKELEQIKTEFNERIDALLKKAEDVPTPKQEFEVGKWYLRDNGALLNFKGNGKGFGFSSNPANNWASDFYMGNDVIKHFRPATKSETKEALVKEAEKREFKGGVVFESTKGVGLCTIHTISNPIWEYRADEDCLYLNDSCVYNKGKWAEIIKDQPIRIGGYEVRFVTVGEKGMPQCNTTTIDGNYFSSHFWQAAKIISEHSNASVYVGCSAKTNGNNKWMVSLETINQILEKL